LETFLDPQIPKKLLQSKFSSKKTEDPAPVPEPDYIQVPGHNGGSTKVQGYKRYTTTPVKSLGNKKKDKAINSNKKTGQAKHGDMEHFPNWRLATRTRGMLRKHSVCTLSRTRGNWPEVLKNNNNINHQCEHTNY
jgi:hypothetical protein